MNYLTKEFVNSFYWFSHGKENYKKEVINGRTYWKSGTLTTMTYVGNVFRVYDQVSNSYKYVLYVGIARQHPNDVKLDKELALETAAENAMVNPIIMQVFDNNLSEKNFLYIVREYDLHVEKQFHRTKKEIIINDVNKMIRSLIEEAIARNIEINKDFNIAVNDYISRYVQEKYNKYIMMPCIL